MVGTNFMDEMDCVNFFDNIDDLLDVPTDELDADLVGGCGDSDAFPSAFLGGSSAGTLLGFDSVFSGNSASDLSAELSVPYEDIVQLEWLSNFMEDSFSGGGMTMEKTNVSSTNNTSQTQFQTSSPISVLESSSSCSDSKAVPISHEKRARSKRPRPATFNPRPAIQLISPSSSITENPLNAVFLPCVSSESLANSAESQPKKKKKKTKNIPPLNLNQNQNQNLNPNPNAAALVAVRKCMHCEITKTPQWRAGPMGPKTLCNACGVRYKSGRLFPEYRPAASPTFIPSVHSNSHKKVIEMRISSSGEKPQVPDNTQQLVLIPRSDILPTTCE